MSQIDSSATYIGSYQDTNILAHHKIMVSTTTPKKTEKCFVRNCMSGKNKNGDTSGISFHTFPTYNQPQRRQQWQQLLQLDTPVPTNAVVCSRHFDSTDFFLINSVQKGQMYRVLRKTAIPNRCLPGFGIPTVEIPPRPKHHKVPTERKPIKYVSKDAKIDKVKSFCRCCLKVDTKSQTMKDTRMVLDGATINLFDAFFDCTSFKALKIDDQAQICDKCIEDLKRTIVFLSQCQASDELINNLFGSNSTMGDTTDTENDEGGDLLVPMRNDPVIQPKQEPKSSPMKPIVKTEVVDIDYEDVISKAQIKPTRRGYAVKQTTQMPVKPKQLVERANSDADIGELMDPDDSEWTLKSMRNVSGGSLNSTLKKRGRPRKRKSKTLDKLATPRDSLKQKDDSETDTAESGVGGSTALMSSPRKSRQGGGIAKRKYAKKVYLGPTAPLDISEIASLTGAKAATSLNTAVADTDATTLAMTGQKKRWPYACKHCNETFKLQVYLRYHQKSVHPKPNSAPKFQTLVTDKTGGKKWGCKRCSQTFTSPDGFQQHLREHMHNSRKKPKFECSMCQTGFFLMERFEGHIVKEHKITMEKYTPKYHCNRCKMNFHVAVDFYNHPKFCKGLRNNQEMSTDKPTTNGANMDGEGSSQSSTEIPQSFFFCYHCSTGYLEKKYFDEHLDECYTNTELFCKCCICDLDVHLIDCNFKWPERVEYKIHMMSAHKIKYNPEIHGPKPYNTRLSIDDSEEEFFGF